MKRTDNRFCFYSPAIAYVKTFLWLMQYRKGEREEFSVQLEVFALDWIKESLACVGRAWCRYRQVGRWDGKRWMFLSHCFYFLIEIDKSIS